MVAGLDEATVGFVFGRFNDRTAVQDVIEEYSFDAITFDTHEAFTEAVDEHLESLDYLVLEGGSSGLDLLDTLRGSDTDVPVMYIDSDPEMAKRAMTSGASVYLDATNISRLGTRLESLFIGDNVDTADEFHGFEGLGNVHYLAYATLMEEFEDHIYVFDRHGRFVRVNTAKAEFHEKEPADLVGKSDFDYFEPETALEIYQDSYEVMELDTDLESKPEWVTNSVGELVHVTASKHPIKNTDGVVIGYIGISREITPLTKQKALVESMKEAIEYLYGAYDHNFRNKAQRQIGITSKMNAGFEHGNRVTEQLDDLASAIQQLESRLEERPVDDELPLISSNSGTDDSIQDIDSIYSEMESCWEDAMLSFDDARAAEEALFDELQDLILDFSELIATVKTTGELAEHNVGEAAQQVFDRSIDYDDVFVEADDRKLAIMFDQIRKTVDDIDDVAVRADPAGFRIELPVQVTVPEIDERFEAQDLTGGVKPMLKLRLLAETQGWEITVDAPDETTTVLTVDVTAWKQSAGGPSHE